MVRAALELLVRLQQKISSSSQVYILVFGSIHDDLVDIVYGFGPGVTTNLAVTIVDHPATSVCRHGFMYDQAAEIIVGKLVKFRGGGGRNHIC